MTMNGSDLSYIEGQVELYREYPNGLVQMDSLWDIAAHVGLFGSKLSPRRSLTEAQVAYILGWLAGRCGIFLYPPQGISLVIDPELYK